VNKKQFWWRKTSWNSRKHNWTTNDE